MSSDLFLSYHRSDKESVEQVRQILNARGVSSFIDHQDLSPGLPWPQALEQALRNVAGVAVFVGRELGMWQKREMYFALDRQAGEERDGRAFPVIPVILPEADLTSSFLFLNTWVDLRQDVTSAEAIDQIVRVIRGKIGPKPADNTTAVCPYRGLKAFREEHAAFFCGREVYTSRLLEKVLRQNGLVAVVGPSGTGKSSLVLCGLLPLLRRQRPPATTWDAVTFTPGDRPFHRLAASLIPLLEPSITSAAERLSKAQQLGESLASGLPLAEVAEMILGDSKGTDRLLVVVDQFEEIITLTPEKHRSSFLKAMVAALGHSPIEFVITLRADYYGHVVSLNRELSDRLEQCVVNLGPMTPDELGRAIVQPAKKVGLDFEAGLVERLLNDVGDEPGNLPLLEFALTELWTARQSRSMTHAAYEKFGGLAKAISHTAHAELEKFTPEQQRTVRQILTRLVHVVTPGEALEDTRQRVSLNELGADARPIVDELAKARLLVTARDADIHQDTVEISHEALIQGWSDLRAWLNEDREFLLWRQRLNLYSTVWQRANRDDGGLLRGALLTEAERWQASHATGLNDEERDFIGKSTERRSKEVLEEEGRRRRRVTTLVVSLLIMAALASFAGVQWYRAVSQRRIAEAGTLLSAARLITTEAPSKFDQAALLAIESLRLDDTAEARSILRDAVRLLPQRTAQVEINCDGRIKISAGGSFLTCLDGTNRSARIISVSNGKDLPQSRVTETREIATADASPNGKFIGIGLRQGGFKLIDAESGRAVISENRGVDAIVAFSANGKLFAASIVDQATTTIHVITISDKVAPAYTLKVGHPVLGLTLSPDGAFLAALHQGSLNTEITIFDLASRQSRTIRGGAAFPAMALSSGGNFIALPDLDNAVHVKDTVNNATENKLASQQLAYAVALSEDGKFVASGSEDGTARVMETGTGRVIALVPTGSPVKSVVFTATNDLVVASNDKTIRTVNILKRPAFEALHVYGTIAISPRGRYLTTFSPTTTSELAIVDRVTGEKPLRQQLPRDLVTTGVMRYSTDEEYLVVTGIAHGMTAYELKTGKTQHKPAPPGLTALTISGDGRTVAWASAKNIEVFRTDDSRQDRLDFSNTRVLELSAEGQFVAAAGKDPTLSIFDVTTKNKLFDVQSEASVKKAAFSPDGRYLVTSTDNRHLILSDMRSHQTVWRLKDAEASLLVFSHDGSILLIGGSGEGDAAFDVKLIETATGKTLFAVRRETQPLGAAFSIDGHYFDIVDDTSITRHYLRSEDLIEQTCKLLTRNLRQDEWNTFLASKAYRSTCPL